MKKLVLRTFVALAVLAALFSGCTPAIAPPTITPIPATVTPLPTLTPTHTAITVDNRSVIIGRWTEIGGGVTIEFFEDGTFTSDDGPGFSGTYNFTDGDTIIAKVNPSGNVADSTVTADVEISGDTLTLTTNGDSTQYIRANDKDDSKLIVEGQINEDELQRLITVEEVAELAVDLGIENWKLDREEIGKARICRYFLGQSWSINPNNATNCIWKSAPNITFTEVVQWLKDNKVTNPSASTVKSSYDYGSDFALFAYIGSNGQSVYDAFLLKDNFLYLASITLGTEPGVSPENLFSKNGNVIDSFLHSVLIKNLAEGK